MTMYFDIELSPLPLSLLGALFIITLLLVTLYRSRVRLPVKCRVMSRSGADDTTVSAGSVPVTVVVYARDNSERLESLLQDLLQQEYQPGYEIVVVNDSGGYACSDVVTRLSLTHTNLRMTFIPEQAHNLSRKKLAITLGLKAARNEMVVILNAECKISSTRWLAGMVSTNADIVLGQAVITADDGSALPLMMRLDEANTAITWIGAAMRGKAYRGNGYNIAYRKSIFFDNGGFSGSLNLQAGDDDLLIYKMARHTAPRPILSPDSIVGISTSRPERLYRELKTSHMFTGRQLPSHPVMSLAPLCLWFGITLAAVASWLSFPNMTVTAVSAILLLIQWIVTGCAWSKASAAVGIHIGAWKAIPALLWLPFHNMRYRVIARRNKSQHYTWQKERK